MQYSAFLQQMAQYNKAVNRQYKVGDLLYLSNPVLEKNQVKKFQQAWKGPYPVIEVCSPVTLKLQLPFHSVIVHVNRVQLHYLPQQLTIKIVLAGDYVSYLQPRLQSRRGQDLQLQRLQVLPQHAPKEKQQRFPLPIPHRHW
ncbi:hypothetical protein PR048_002483 [Dryococelus australis]|uniref:Uncharacterized protein n=1 Tax=Dryococelus australis TaxID=614101 RepID=A0ABQ9IKC1_9NEOP|nr:hypothetical protein PR048_002483 [Dryococelus australis]